jgi:hypothetical protein
MVPHGNIEIKMAKTLTKFKIFVFPTATFDIQTGTEMANPIIESS